MDPSMKVLQHQKINQLFDMMNERVYLRSSQFKDPSKKFSLWISIRSNKDLDLIKDFDNSLPKDLDRFVELIGNLVLEVQEIEHSGALVALTELGKKYGWTQTQISYLETLTTLQLSSVILSEIFLGKKATTDFRAQYKSWYGGIEAYRTILESTQPDYLQEMLDYVRNYKVARLVKSHFEEFDALGELIIQKLRKNKANPNLVFICHSSLDIDLVNKLAEKLGRIKDLDIFIAHKTIPEGKKWPAEIRTSILSCSIFIPIITENFLKSAYANQEAGIALYLYESNENPVIFPFSFIHGDDKRLGMFTEIQIKKRDINNVDLELDKFCSQIEKQV